MGRWSLSTNPVTRRDRLRIPARNNRQSVLIKFGICVGEGLESTLRNHVQRAMQDGPSEAEIEQARLLGMRSPSTVAAWFWGRQQIERGS